MAEFHIRLQYISKQNTDAENVFYLEYSIDMLPKPAFFLTRHEVSRGGGGQDGVHAHQKIWPKLLLCP